MTLGVPPCWMTASLPPTNQLCACRLVPRELFKLETRISTLRSQKHGGRGQTQARQRWRKTSEAVEHRNHRHELRDDRQHVRGKTEAYANVDPEPHQGQGDRYVQTKTKTKTKTQELGTFGMLDCFGEHLVFYLGNSFESWLSVPLLRSVYCVKTKPTSSHHFIPLLFLYPLFSQEEKALCVCKLKLEPIQAATCSPQFYFNPSPPQTSVHNATLTRNAKTGPDEEGT